MTAPKHRAHRAHEVTLAVLQATATTPIEVDNTEGIAVAGGVWARLDDEAVAS